MCQICLEVPNEPSQHKECGKLFCKRCLIIYGLEKPCPNCRVQHPKYITSKHQHMYKCAETYIEILNVKDDARKLLTLE